MYKKRLQHLPSCLFTLLRYIACVLVALYLPALLNSGYITLKEFVARQRSYHERHEGNIASNPFLLQNINLTQSPSSSDKIIAEALAPAPSQDFITAALRQKLIAEGKFPVTTPKNFNDENEVHLHPDDIEKMDSYLADIIGISYEEFKRLAESPISYDEETQKKAEALYNELFKYTDDYIDPKIYNEKTVAY